MKHWLIVWVVFSLLLSGCDLPSSSLTESSEALESISAEEQSSEPIDEKMSEHTNEELSTEEQWTKESEHTSEEVFTTEQWNTEFSFLDNAIEVGYLGNSFYVPNEELEEMPNPEMYLMENAILLNATMMDGENGCKSILKLISLEDGSLLGEASFFSSGFLTIQIGDGGIGICDSQSGFVKILDKTLQVVENYELEADGYNWYLSNDLKTLYKFQWQYGVFAMDLSSEYSSENIVLDQIIDVYVTTQNEDAIVFSYTDKKSQKTFSKNLNLKNGMIESLPVVGSVASGVFVDGTWVIGDSADWGTYHIITNENKMQVFWPQNLFTMLEPKGHLFSLNIDGRKLNLYEKDGTFLSTCEFLQEADCFIGQNVIWSDLWNGYFFLQYGAEVTPKLIFWDIEVPTIGEDLDLIEDETQEGSNVLYQRAREISEQYGVQVLIADQCQLDYLDFTATVANEEAFIEQTLNTLEHVLSVYPEGFFSQLHYGNIQTIQIELVSTLTPKNKERYSGNYSGFALEELDRYLIVVDLYQVYEGTFYHEIAHMIDKRLAWDANIRENALFSEEAWLALQPEGFSYPYTYGELPAEVLEFVDSGYFVTDYSCRYPTEDRATMMEHAMWALEDPYTFEQNPHLYEKLEYYSKCIRDCFDTNGWDEVVQWEKILQEK